MEIAEHISALREEGQRLAGAAAAADWDAPVPSCPDWVMRDLVRHIGGVHRWAAGVVGGRRIEAWNVELEEVVGFWPADAEILAWFEEGHAELIEILTHADPSLICWTFLPAPSALAMWARRQAHETAVHRVDAELAAGLPTTDHPPAFAADGIDELLSCFITRAGGRLRSDPPRSLRVRCTDTVGDWLVSIGPDGVRTTAGADGADTEVAGRAADLYLALWNRRPVDDLLIEGDGGVLAMFADRVRVRWS